MARDLRSAQISVTFVAVAADDHGVATWQMVSKSQWLLVDGRAVLAEINLADVMVADSRRAMYHAVSDRLEHPMQFGSLEGAQRVVARRVLTS